MAPLNQQPINLVHKKRKKEKKRKCAPTQLEKLGGQWMTHGPDCCRESRPPLPPPLPPPSPPPLPPSPRIHHIPAPYHRISGPPVPAFLHHHFFRYLFSWPFFLFSLLEINTTTHHCNKISELLIRSASRK